MDASVILDDDIVYYVAASLDGYIASPDGNVDWLGDYFIPELGFHDFFAHMRGVIMGRGTWDKINDMGRWPYGALPCTVATNRELGPTTVAANTASGHPAEILAAAQEQSIGPYWIVGGADLATQFLEARALTRIDLFTIPVLLGDGIPAFRNKQLTTLDLKDSQTYPKGIIRTSWQPKSDI